MTRSRAPVARRVVAPGLILALTPAGTLVVRDAPDDGPLDPASAERIAAAFARGTGHGLLQLGAAEVDTSLPPGVAFWRNVARAFVTQLCALPEVGASRRRLHVPFPETEIAALAVEVDTARSNYGAVPDDEEDAATPE